jgi:hypothetical protein
MTSGPPIRLDHTKPQSVQYAVDLRIRDEQIKVNTARVLGRIAPQHDTRVLPIAIACYGPSLNDTWEQIRDFQFVISCSGSHKFLLERGIVPRWHVEVDPRAHKIELLGEPHPDVEYLVASTCHPAYVEHLLKFNATVKLWHVFENKADAIRTLPPGEWALTGGCSVGLRALTIARFFGFLEQHVFGMDGSEGPTGKHAAAHPSQPKGHALVEYEGVTYQTTPSMLECARGTWHELNQMPDVKATFYGTGLIQHMAQHYVPNPIGKGKAMIGMVKPELISVEYAALNAQLHRENLAYGIGGGRHAPTVLKLVESLQTRSVLDYGCGKGYLAKAIPFPIWEYDPAIPMKAESPRPADLVVCTDVLEHIEPEKLGPVLEDLQRCVRKVGFFVIHTGPAQKTLADGRNAHLLQRDAQWWRLQLQQFFLVGQIKPAGVELYVIVGPKQHKKRKAA